MNGSYSIDMFDVNLGDLIVLELGAPNGRKISIIIDGGCKDAAEKTLPLIQAYHGNNTCVVISTHPDNDHMGGLPTIIEALKPVEVYVNNPLNFITRQALMQNAAVLETAERDRLRAAIERTENTVVSSSKVGAAIKDVFASDSYVWNGWKISFLNPNKEIYELLWGTREGLKELYAEKVVTKSDELRRRRLSVLDDGTDATHMNNTSVITLVEGYGKKLLFTGDAGMYALYAAAEYADLRNLDFFDCPHHGSRRNLNTAIIKHLKPQVTFVSTPKEHDSLPGNEVLATLQQHGGHVFTTKHHSSMCLSWNCQTYRYGYDPIRPIPLLLDVAIVRT